MKIKVRQREPIINETEVELPFYSYVQEDLNDIFVKVDETKLHRIDFSPGAIEAFCCDRGSSLSKYWFDNPCTKEKYDNAVKRLKEYINNF